MHIPRKPGEQTEVDWAGDTAVIPARVRAPKHKSSAEGTVGIISTWITAAIRNEKFFSQAEKNREIHRRLENFNHAPFQKKEGSRYCVFHADEKPLADKYSVERIETACQKALSYTSHPDTTAYGYTRGAEYYGGKNR